MVISEWCQKPIPNTIGGIQDGRTKLITYAMEMPVPHSFYPKISEEGDIRKIETDIREILRTLCRYKKVEIIEGAVCVDHVHLCVSIPPKLAISEFMGYLKGKSALMIYDRHPELGNKFERDFWARGYYVSTIGNVDEATIRKYIREQEEESYKEARTTR